MERGSGSQNVGGRSERSNAVGEPPLFGSAVEAANAVRSGRVSARELTEDVLRRIDLYNDALNAIVTWDAEGAMEQARRLDEHRIAGQEMGALHGVPCCIKDSFAVKGMRTVCGADFLTDYIPEKDAVVVERLRRAGAIIVGKTNTPLMTQDWQTFNDVFGISCNPWDVTRTPGGSTGGGAAAIAAGMDYVTVGSDLGGSLRGPAHFCGIYAHKPSLNVVPLDGHIPPHPRAVAEDHQVLAVAGPLARNAADLRLVLGIIGGPAGAFSKAFKWTLPPPRRKRLGDYRVGYVLDSCVCRVSSSLLGPLQDFVDRLGRVGVHLREGWPRGVAPESQRNWFEYIAATHRAGSVDARQVERLKGRLGRENTRTEILVRAVTDAVGDYQKALQRRLYARRAWQEFFEDFDAFVTPVTFVPAFPHDTSDPQSERILMTPEGARNYLDLTSWCSFASVAGLPATVVPVERTAEGLPVGAQIIGPYLEDATPLDIAEMVS